MDVQNGVPKMDKFAEVEWRKYARSGGAAREAMGKQFARLVMAHIDCDTIPFFWRYASRFTIFDNNFATEDTPSTPNAVAMIAGQSGETQWVKHPSETTRRHPGAASPGRSAAPINGETYSGTATTSGPPLVERSAALVGLEFDKTVVGREPAGSPKEWYKLATTSPRTSPSRRCRSPSWAGGSTGSPTRIAIRPSTSPT